VEHNHPDLILQLPEGPTAFIEFTVCRDDSVVERAKFKEDKYRLLAEDWAKKHDGRSGDTQSSFLSW
jgi:hypothetical protein